MSRRLLDRGRYRNSICFRSLLILLKYIKGAERLLSRVALDFFKIPSTSDQASGRSCGGSWGSRWSFLFLRFPFLFFLSTPSNPEARTCFLQPLAGEITEFLFLRFTFLVCSFYDFQS